MLFSSVSGASVVLTVLASARASVLPRESASAVADLPYYCKADPSASVDLILITNLGICLNTTSSGMICGPQMTKVPLKCSDGATSGFGYSLSSYGPYGQAMNPSLVGKEKACVANGMPPYPQVQPILEFILDKKDGPMFTSHNTGSMNLMCGY